MWIILMDLINGPLEQSEMGTSDVPISEQISEYPSMMPIPFRLLDGDDNVYFMGIISKDDDPFDPLDLLGRAYGCTSIETYDHGTEEWIPT